MVDQHEEGFSFQQGKQYFIQCQWHLRGMDGDKVGNNCIAWGKTDLKAASKQIELPLSFALIGLTFFQD